MTLPPSPPLPGSCPAAYTVRLIAAGESLSQPLTIVMDPRVKTSHFDLEQQFNLSHTLYEQMLASHQGPARDHGATRSTRRA